MQSMTTPMTYSTYGNSDQQTTKRVLPLIGIVVAHAGLIYALNAGLLTTATQILPKELVVSLIAPSKPLPEQAPPKVSLPKLSPQQPVFAPMPEVTVPMAVTPAIQASSTPVTATVTADQAPAKTEVSAPVIAAAPPQPKVVTGVEYIQAPQAEYPPLSRRMKEEGKVVLRVLVNEKGRAEKVEIQKSSGSNRLDEAARIAILRALFKPYIEDGKPLMMLATAVISFSLNS